MTVSTLSLYPPSHLALRAAGYHALVEENVKENVKRVHASKVVKSVRVISALRRMALTFPSIVLGKKDHHSWMGV